MKWWQARRKCLKIQKRHDRAAKASFDEYSCGYCGTEDCSCNGYDEECDCGFCTDVFNKENGFPLAATWKQLLERFLR